MTGRRSHGRLSALNGVVHQGNESLIDHLTQAFPSRLPVLFDQPVDNSDYRG